MTIEQDPEAPVGAAIQVPPPDAAEFAAAVAEAHDRLRAAGVAVPASLDRYATPPADPPAPTDPRATDPVVRAYYAVHDDPDSVPEVKCVICGLRAPRKPLVCDRCRQREAARLSEIVTLYALLPAALDVNPNTVVDLTYPPVGGAASTAGRTCEDCARQAKADGAVVPLGPCRRVPPHGRPDYDDQRGDIAVAAVLDSWVREWASTLRCPDLPKVPTVMRLAMWLQVWLPLACDHHPAVDEYAAEIRQLSAKMRRAINRDLTAVHYEAPCPYCKTKTLRREPGGDWIECVSVVDKRRCPGVGAGDPDILRAVADLPPGSFATAVRNSPAAYAGCSNAANGKPCPGGEAIVARLDGCGRLWGEDEYGLLARASIDPAELINTEEAAIVADVEPAKIRLWAHRGKLTAEYQEGSTKPWYRKGAVEELAERMKAQ